MAIYQEDDDLDLERELEDIERNQDGMARDMERMAVRGNHIRKTLKKRQLDPLVAKAIELAQNLGHVLGANESMSNRLKNLNKRIAIRDEEIERTSDRDELLTRAEEAEAKLARRRKRR